MITGEELKQVLGEVKAMEDIVPSHINEKGVRFSIKTQTGVFEVTIKKT